MIGGVVDSAVVRVDLSLIHISCTAVRKRGLLSGFVRSGQRKKPRAARLGTAGGLSLIHISEPWNADGPCFCGNFDLFNRFDK